MICILCQTLIRMRVPKVACGSAFVSTLIIHDKRPNDRGRSASQQKDRNRSRSCVYGQDYPVQDNLPVSCSTGNASNNPVVDPNTDGQRWTDSFLNSLRLFDIQG